MTAGCDKSSLTTIGSASEYPRGQFLVWLRYATGARNSRHYGCGYPQHAWIAACDRCVKDGFN